MQCSFVKPGGERCAARCIRGRLLCFFHDPSKETERTNARRAGGKGNGAVNHKVPALIEEVASPAAIVSILSDTMIRLRAGEIDPKIANTLGFLAGVQLKAVEQADAGKQMGEFRRLLAHRANEDNNSHLLMNHLMAG